MAVCQIWKASRRELLRCARVPFESSAEDWLVHEPENKTKQEKLPKEMTLQWLLQPYFTNQEAKARACQADTQKME